jgi:hypothetical protein
MRKAAVAVVFPRRCLTQKAHGQKHTTWDGKKGRINGFSNTTGAADARDDNSLSPELLDAEITELAPRTNTDLATSEDEGVVGGVCRMVA